MVFWGVGAVFKKYCIYAKPVTSHHSHNSTISSSYFSCEEPRTEWTLPCLSQVWSWNLQPGRFHTAFHSTVYQPGGKVGSSIFATSTRPLFSQGNIFSYPVRGLSETSRIYSVPSLL